MDFLTPLSDQHQRSILREWVAHYNQGRPHSRLGRGIPDGRGALRPRGSSHHHLPHGHRVVVKSILSGLHDEYRLAKVAA
jgi:hypothetical protein